MFCLLIVSLLITLHTLLDLLDKLFPIGTTGLTVDFPTHPSATEIKFSFPTSPDAESLRSTEAKSPSLSESLSLPTKSGNSSNALRRALSSHNTPRNSVDGTSPSEKETEKNDFGKLNKLGGKRVRAVSLRLSKRYSLLGNKSSGDKVSQSRWKNSYRKPSHHKCGPYRKRKRSKQPPNLRSQTRKTWAL